MITNVLLVEWTQCCDNMHWVGRWEPNLYFMLTTIGILLSPGMPSSSYSTTLPHLTFIFHTSPFQHSLILLRTKFHGIGHNSWFIFLYLHIILGPSSFFSLLPFLYFFAAFSHLPVCQLLYFTLIPLAHYNCLGGKHNRNHIILSLLIIISRKKLLHSHHRSSTVVAPHGGVL